MTGIGWLTEPLTQYFAPIIIVILVVVVILVVIALQGRRKAKVSWVKLLIDTTNVDDAVNRIKDAATHYADVSAVVELMKQLDANPDAKELLKNYPETVRAAAWLHYINALGHDLQQAQASLSEIHQYHGDRLYKQAEIERRQQHVDLIREKLDGAIQASGQSYQLHSV